MEKTIYGNDGTVTVVESSHGITTIHMDNAYQWDLDRAQVRALIEALRQADAETRAECEVIVRRHEDGTGVRAYGLEPGSIHERLLASWNSSGPIHGLTTDRARAWWEETRATLYARNNYQQFINATVICVGFPDEPTE